MRVKTKNSILQKAIRGDGSAFAQLYDEHQSVIFRFVAQRVEDEQTAEDLTATIFMKCWEKLGKYQDRGLPFRAWLFRVARNAVIDHYRTRKLQSPLELVLNVADKALPVLDWVSSRIETKRITDMLNQLTLAQQDVLKLRLIDGLTTDQTAASLHKTAGAIRALQMRGLHSMAKLIRASDPELEPQFT